MNGVPHIPKGARYTIGTRIENLFLDELSLLYTTYFTPLDQQLPKLNTCILSLNALKFILGTAWEGKIIPNQLFEDVSLKLNEVGKMLSGWKNNTIAKTKKNRQENISAEKNTFGTET